jgi:TolB-like protein
MNTDGESDFLRFALADEIANALTAAHSLEIRPSASTQKYATGDVDPAKAGRELGVGIVVTGQFYRQKNMVRVTVQAIEVKNNRLIWSETVRALPDDSIALQNQITTRIRQDLIPILGVSNAAVEKTSVPTNQEGYDLYLRTVSMPHDGTENKDAIARLQRAVELDPKYAPSWEALGRRLYFDAIYSGGGAAGYQRSNAAFEQALALEPGRVNAAAFLTTNEVEGGKLDKAYSDARALVRKRPDAAIAHYSMGYVLRYVGLLDEAQQECEAAMMMDPKNYNWRSCSFAYFEQGKPARAMDFINLDATSEYSNAVRVWVLMREGNKADALQAAQQMTENAMWMRGLTEACLSKAPAAEVHRLAEEAENKLLPEQDPELKYAQGTVLAGCGEKKIALEFLRGAVAGNYCAHEALKADPLLAGVRQDAEFGQIVQTAAECQQRLAAAQGIR